MHGLAALLGGVSVALVVASAPAAAEVLGDIARLAVSVDVEAPVPGVREYELSQRLAAFLAELRPSVALDETSQDRVRLTVAVRPHSSSALRGFPLPFSGTYGIGTVRLGLERAVHLPGRTPRTIPAIVWQRERLVATRWAAAGAAIAAAVDELLRDLRAATSCQAR